MTWLHRLITVKLTAAFDAALFYVTATYLLHMTITWPIVFAVAWAVDTAYGIDIRRRSEAGLL